jgi:DNA-binding response OmpR family regulator
MRFVMTRKALAVDDDDEFLDLLRVIFDSMGVELITAPRGDEGLALFLAERPSLVLLDSAMPGLSGPALCARIRQTPGAAAVRVIMLTGVVDVESKVTALQGGADDYIGKPIALAELWARVQVHIRALDQMEGALEVQRRSSERASERTSLFSALRSQLQKLGDTPSELPGHAERLSGIVSTLDRLDGADPAHGARNGTIARHAGLQKALASSSLPGRQ